MRLGPYEVAARIGAGGMGEVYRARDTRLGRDVAIKILKRGFTERFEREARAISALNHPNICSLYDIGAEDGVDFLVMELVEGTPLKGPMPAADAVRYGIQIADALDAAHRKGIVHRDLKPANVLVTRSGVKLLDFGLAKAAPADLPGATITRPITGKGQIVGTIQYMAPEQLESREADARSDIFAFGCVLYEALAGRPAFEGGTPASVIAAIMATEPKPLSDVKPPAPEALERIVNTCLAKDPGERFQTARDLKRALEWSLKEQPYERPKRRAVLLPWIVAAVAVIAAIGAAALAFRKSAQPPAAAAIRFRFAEPEGTWLQRYITRQSFAVSPTGGRIAMVARDARGQMIWVRRLGELKPAALAGTEGAQMVFWSPDSKYIGFYANGKLRRIPSGGGMPAPICDMPELWSAAWSPRGDILLQTRDDTRWVNVETGAVSKWKTVIWPLFVAEGKRIIYLERGLGGIHAFIQDWPDGKPVKLMTTHTRIAWAPGPDRNGPGYLLYGRDGTLLAQPFDPMRPGVNAEPIGIAQGVPYFRPSGWSEFDVSQDGVLVFGAGLTQAQLTWLDRTGRDAATVGDARAYWGSVRLAPASSRIFADIVDPPKGATDAWAIDARTGAAERLTFDPGVEASPVPSRDGTRIAFGSAQTTPPQLRFSVSGQPGPPAEYAPAPFQIPTDWSPDSRWIAYQTSGGETPGEIWFASAADDRKVYPVRQTPGYHNSGAVFSPDGKYLAYLASETGRPEIYVQAIDTGTPPRLTGDKRRVSFNGGTAPRWRRDGRELFFLGLESQLMAAAVTKLPDFAAPVRLFDVPASANAMNPLGLAYDVDQSGGRFLIVNRKRVQEAHLEAVVNWQEALRP